MNLPVTLTKKQSRFLKSQAHNLNPVVTIGNNGVSESLIAELSAALETHELMKIKLPGGEKADRQAMLDAACEGVGASCVGMIGRVGIVYRPAKTPGISLPD